jgi:hypothetical protein
MLCKLHQDDSIGVCVFLQAKFREPKTVVFKSQFDDDDDDDFKLPSKHNRWLLPHLIDFRNDTWLRQHPLNQRLEARHLKTHHHSHQNEVSEVEVQMLEWRRIQVQQMAVMQTRTLVAVNQYLKVRRWLLLVVSEVTRVVVNFPPSVCGKIKVPVPVDLPWSLCEVWNDAWRWMRWIWRWMADL